jgi:hypothetical protein
MVLVARKTNKSKPTTSAATATPPHPRDKELDEKAG